MLRFVYECGKYLKYLYSDLISILYMKKIFFEYVSCSEIGSPHCIANAPIAAAVGALRRCEVRRNDRRLAAPERRGHSGGSRVGKQVAESSGDLAVQQVARKCFTVHDLRYLR